MLFHSPHHPSQWKRLPKQGCEAASPAQRKIGHNVSVEPLPKQGCEALNANDVVEIQYRSQWNPCRSRGASRLNGLRCNAIRSLSGTPAEAGVRVGYEVANVMDSGSSQWNPCRSRGASFHALRQ